MNRKRPSIVFWIENHTHGGITARSVRIKEETGRQPNRPIGLSTAVSAGARAPPRDPGRPDHVLAPASAGGHRVAWPDAGLTGRSHLRHNLAGRLGGGGHRRSRCRPLGRCWRPPLLLRRCHHRGTSPVHRYRTRSADPFGGRSSVRAIPRSPLAALTGRLQRS